MKMIRWFEKRRFFAILMVFLIGIEIYYFSSLTFEGAPGGIPYLAIGYHFVVFFLFSFFLFISVKGIKELKISHLAFVLLISLIYSILDEVHQIFTPSREPSVRDIIINNTGIFLSTLVYSYVNLKRIK